MLISALFRKTEMLSAGRDAEEYAVYELLNGLSVPFERVDHDEAATIELCREVEAVLGVPIPKNLFLCNRQKTAFYLLLIDGAKPFKTKYLSSQIGSSRLSFAAPEDMERLLGVRPGSASVLALMNDTEGMVTLLVDESVRRLEKAGFHPCRNTATVSVSMHDLFDRFLPAVKHNPVFVSLPEERDDA